MIKNGKSKFVYYSKKIKYILLYRIINIIKILNQIQIILELFEPQFEFNSKLRLRKFNPNIKNICPNPPKYREEATRNSTKNQSYHTTSKNMKHTFCD